MGKEKLNLQEISSAMMQLFVQDVFNKNNITKENKKSLSEDQKDQLKKVVEDLQAQVEEFIQGTKQKEEENKPKKVESPKNLTLREMIQKKKR